MVDLKILIGFNQLPVGKTVFQNGTFRVSLLFVVDNGVNVFSVRTTALNDFTVLNRGDGCQKLSSESAGNTGQGHSGKDDRYNANDDFVHFVFSFLI